MDGGYTQLVDTKPITQNPTPPEPVAIPAGAQLLLEFLNTVDLEHSNDELRTPEVLQIWLRDHGLIAVGDEVTAADLTRVVEVREALRALMLGNTGLPVDPAAPAALDRQAATSLLQVRVDAAGGVALEPVSRGVDAAVARLLAVVAATSLDGTWRRLKACRKHSCRWAFYDRSKNGSRSWCSMRVCGNRTKARLYRERAASRG